MSRSGHRCLFLHLCYFRQLVQQYYLPFLSACQSWQHFLTYQELNAILIKMMNAMKAIDSMSLSSSDRCCSCCTIFVSLFVYLCYFCLMVLIY
jgi:hypothetical protein